MFSNMGLFGHLDSNLLRLVADECTQLAAVVLERTCIGLKTAVRAERTIIMIQRMGSE